MKPAIALILAICLGLPSTASARKRHHKRSKPASGKTSSDPSAEGRAHLKKANALAGEDNCEAAIKEYTLAHDMLGDPVILFNRAECYRRTGDKTNAVEDYRDFLEDVPAAPNRADIEAKIAALNVAATAPGAATEPTAVAPAAPARSVARAAKAPPPAPAPVTSQESPPVVEIEVDAGAEKPRESSGPSSRFWLWTAVAVAVAGGAAAAVFFLRPGDATPPATTFGNYRF